MAESARFTDEERSDLKDRLEKLDRFSIAVFATRCALRVFPLLFRCPSSSKYFQYWKEQDRTGYLLAVWRAQLLLLSSDKTYLSTFDAANNANDAANNANDAGDSADYYADNGGDVISYDAANVAYAAAFAHSAVKYVAEGASTSAVQDVIEVATYAAIDVINDIDVNFKREIEFDLKILDQGESHLSTLPLIRGENVAVAYRDFWQRHLPLAIQSLIDAIPPQLQRQQGSETVAILQSIYPIYQGIYQGKLDQAAIQNALTQLERYFFEGEANTNTNDAERVDHEQAIEQARVDDVLISENVKTVAGHSHSNHQLAKEDKLDRKKLVETLADLLQAPDNSHHQTIGLLGHWGVGKSSVVELLKASLKNRVEHRRLTGREILDKGSVYEPMEPMPEFLFAEFNAWEYEHTDNLQAGIAQEMIKTLSSPEPNTKLFGKVKWLLLRKPWLVLRFALNLHQWKLIWPLVSFLLALIALLFALIPDVLPTSISNFFNSLFGDQSDSILPFVWIASVVGFLVVTWKQIKPLFSGPLAKELLTYLKLPNYGKHLGTIPVMRDHIKKLTKVRLKEDQRILYVVDDLDRCGHKGIVKVLEAVRMVLDLDKVVVVIAVDQRIALAALALHYKDLASQHHIEDPRLIARDYLAKIIHLPIVLTEPNDAAVVGYLSHLWNDESWLDTLPLYKNSQSDQNSQKSQNETKEQSIAQETPIETEGEPDRDDVMAENNNSESLADSSEIREEDSSVPNHQAQEEQVITRIVSLSDEQKWAFKHWLTHFELSNPRQIKRLHNSYTLLRNFYPQGERMEGAKEQDGSETFPMMVTLFALEYLNNLNGITKRQQLRKLLSSNVGLETLAEAENQDASNNGDPKESAKIINAYVIELANRDLNGITMTKAIEPFVLPGIEA